MKGRGYIILGILPNHGEFGTVMTQRDGRRHHTIFSEVSERTKKLDDHQLLKASVSAYPMNELNEMK